MSSCLADSDYSPPQIAEDFPEPGCVRIDGDSARLLVGAEKILARGKSADRRLIVAESPCTDAHPSDVFHPIAKLGELPIEYPAHAFGSATNIADPVIDVYH